MKGIRSSEKPASGLNPCFNGRYSLSFNFGFISKDEFVLILVLMEDTHWDPAATNKEVCEEVLILVLMEDTHWVALSSAKTRQSCLNPCFNGRYSLRSTWTADLVPQSCLNPCFNGRYSLSRMWVRLQRKKAVLILVLMEDTHWANVTRARLVFTLS